MRDALIAVALAGCAGCAQFSQSDANTAAVAIANAAGAALGNAGVSSGRSENAAAMNFGSNSYRANCAGGGRSEASYTISNDVVPQTGTGYVAIEMLITFTDCTSGGVLINGNPNINLNGHFTFLSG